MHLKEKTQHFVNSKIEYVNTEIELNVKVAYKKHKIGEKNVCIYSFLESVCSTNTLLFLVSCSQKRETVCI